MAEIQKENVVGFPTTTELLQPEEKTRRVNAEATRMANLAPGEWKLWLRRRAVELDVAPEMLADLIQAKIEDREKKVAEARAKEQLEERRADRVRKTEAQQWREQKRIDDTAEAKAKKKFKAFADLIKLPTEQQEIELAKLAKRLDEDVAALTAEFSEYCATEMPSGGAVPLSEADDVEPWAEPVTTAVLLEELIARINQHINVKEHEALAIALWILMAWVHEVAAHWSVYLVATAPQKDCGKTTLIIEVVGRLAPKAYASGSDPTIAGIFRTADREKPTMLFDNVDTLFDRKPEVTELFLNGWTRGIKYPRTERIGGNWQTVWYDPFCPKACSLIGTNMPPALLDRCLLIEMWPLKADEKVVEVNPFDQELIDAFKTLRRKCMRWSNDNASALKNATPSFPAGFTTRPRSNAKLLLAIAELAGDKLAKQARAALDKLLREKRDPSWLELLLQELWIVFIKEGRKDVASEQLTERLTADPTSPWCDYGRGHAVTQREVAALLRKLHIRPVLVGKGRLGGYRAADFFEKEIFQHFLHRDPLILSPATKPKSSRRK